jgi:hypothetical protein
MDPSRRSVPSSKACCALGPGLLVNFNVTRAAPRPSTPLAAAPSTFRIFPNFLSAFLSLCGLCSLQFRGIEALAVSRRSEAHAESRELTLSLQSG